MKRLPFRLSSFAQVTLSNVEPVRRWVFNLAAGVSIVASAAIVLLWIRSFYAYDFVQWLQPYPGPQGARWQCYSLSSDRGQLNLYYQASNGANVRDVRTVWREQGKLGLHSGIGYPANDSDRRGFWERVGVGFSSGRSSGTFEAKQWSLVLPHWLPLLILLILPASVIQRSLRVRLRVRKGLCPSCRYDLRATPDRCPECGAVPEAAKGAAT